MYRLEEPTYFYLLLLIPLMLVVYSLYLAWRRRAQKAFGDKELLEKLSPERSQNKPSLKFIIYLTVIALISMALVNPQIGSRMEKVQREGLDLVFAIDVSKSMLCEDVQPNRLDRAKLLISRTVDELVSDRIGIITYAGHAYPQLPITTDYNAAKLFLQNINTDLIPSQGTAISDAIDLSTRFFNDEEQPNRLLVILSDGEDHEEGIDDVISKALDKNIQIYTIGFGTERGGPIPIKQGGNITSYKKDQNGETVITKLNSSLLKRIAAEGDGKYFSGNRSKAAVDFLMEEMMKMEKSEFESELYADYEDQFQWLLAPALLLLILDVFILERKTQWFKNLNLFDRHEEL
ncbi:MULTISPECIES: VWA domain-containing protein [Croceimicrobium]|uniref:VWA domain-containing protein n=1 Tax=Croceimicrobium hydrocarbonivorans TaxID=2761580 RepID=A0A7H0VA56_9FLAO|nr:VWA domain-containing protein [Croceimicrobium hydrocarbonivorans]QNR22604.1 VWA domain-containing protein [Croceimicrobium hydrocarbonivorans]